MKNVIISSLFFFISIFSFCQKLTQIEIEKKIHLLFPEDYSVNDTLGAKVYGSEIENGIVGITIFKDIRGNIDSAKELTAFFKNFQDGMIEQSNGRLVAQNFMKIDSRRINKFTLITETPNMIQWNVYNIRVESTTYAIVFIYNSELTKENETEIQIIDSLKFISG